MAVKRFKPVTPALRQMALLSDPSDKKLKIRAIKSLLSKKLKSVGRNNQGRITSRRRGSGVKQRYRAIDFKRDLLNVEAVVTDIQYDPNRTCYIALITYRNGRKSYILAPASLKVGDVVVSSDTADIKPGNSKCLKDIPVGTLLHNIELYPGAGGQLARSAGAYAQLMAKEANEALLRLPSGELRRIRSLCRASIGQVGNLDHEKVNLGKAGRSRLKGRRPSVRGVAMNPVDHPLGGGEGRTSGGRHPVSPWGLPTRGYKTRHNKRTNKFIVKRRK